MKKQVSFLASAFIISAVFPAHSERVSGTNLSVHFESAQITGTGTDVKMHRVPVINLKTGKTTFYDAVFKFTFTPGVGLEFVRISSANVSPPLPASNLRTGIYKNIEGRCYRLAGPTELSNGRVLYTLSPVVDETIDCTRSVMFSAQFVTGKPVGHPDIGGREIASSLTEDYVWGLVATAGICSGTPSCNWDTSELVGLRQNGEQLILALFSSYRGEDFTAPVDSTVLTRIADE